jgi:pilus assembly protein CpaB
MNRQTRTLLVIGLAIVLASVASYAVYRAIQQIPVREVAIATHFTVVANERLPVGSIVDARQVRLVPWPQDAPVAGGFQTVEEVVGRGLIAEVVQNEPITSTKLASRESGGGLPPSIPQGMRAMSVRVNDMTGVAGFAVPGTRVDVIVTVRPDRESISRVVVSNVQVLTAGTRFDSESARTGEAMPAAVVTLLVTPQDAERIALAQNEGSIMLALRNPLDVIEVETRGVGMSGLLAPPAPAPVRTVVRGQPRVAAPPPPPPPPPPYTVETIRGARRTQVTVERSEATQQEP